MIAFAIDIEHDYVSRDLSTLASPFYINHAIIWEWCAVAYGS